MSVLSFLPPVIRPGVLAMSKDHLPIAVDTLGGDHAPDHVVQGAIASGVPVILVGPEAVLGPLLEEMHPGHSIEIVNAEEKIQPDDHPVAAYRSKKNSSMMTAIRLVKEGRAAGVMSAGNTGAFMMGATMMLKRLPYVTRPAAAIPVPTPTGHSLLLDAGASTDCTSDDLLNFAVMGATYVKAVWDVENPRVGLLSIGEEETKGTKQSKETHQRMKRSGLNFIGNVQGNDLVSADVDVVVTDGFTGNVALKSAEGILSLIMSVVRDELKATRGLDRIATWILYPIINRIRKRLDWQEYGGGSLLGVKGNVVIAHGKSRKRAIASAIRLTGELAQTDLLTQLEMALREYHEQDGLTESGNVGEDSEHSRV